MIVRLDLSVLCFGFAMLEAAAKTAIHAIHLTCSALEGMRDVRGRAYPEEESGDAANKRDELNSC